LQAYNNKRGKTMSLSIAGSVVSDEVILRIFRPMTDMMFTMEMDMPLKTRIKLKVRTVLSFAATCTEMRKIARDPTIKPWIKMHKNSFLESKEGRAYLATIGQ
jgi:hypothetical protein